MGKKKLLADALSRLGVLNPLEHLLRSRRAGSLVIFNYHRIGPDEGFSTELEEYVYNATVSELESHVRLLQEHTRLLSEEELVLHLASGVPPSEPCSMLTFDDGYLDNYTLAYPILRARSAPATFFITTGFVEERRLGFWDEVAYLLKRTEVPRLSACERSFSLPEQRREAIDFFEDRIKLEPETRTRDLLDQLSRVCRVARPGVDLGDPQFMTWDHVRDVASNGISIGSHAHTHRVLSTLPLDVQEHELRESKRLIEERVGRPVRSISYPCGEDHHAPYQTRELAASCGYELGFSFLTGYNRWSSIERMAIRRVAAPPDVGTFSATLVLPELFTIRSRG
jgi:peptidoglycan/xylan/chitin deacetylase (PgdA/CDA1 family)